MNKKIMLKTVTNFSAVRSHQMEEQQIWMLL
jgi:hypothetical protein